jgi:hypothetical protein
MLPFYPVRVITTGSLRGTTQGLGYGSKLLHCTRSLAHAGLPAARDTVLGVAMAGGAAVAEVTDTLQDLVMNRLEGEKPPPTPTPRLLTAPPPLFCPGPSSC